MSRDEMSALQGKRLNKLVNLVYHNALFIVTRCRRWIYLRMNIQTI